MKGTLYLLPANLSDGWPEAWVTDYLRDTVKKVDVYVTENQKTARKMIREIYPDKVQALLTLYTFDKDSSIEDIPECTERLLKGESVAYLSEAGLPCIADPGAKLVAWCHRNSVRVVPLSGPSSIVLGLISSGCNGQNFTFRGYLPIDAGAKKKSIRNMAECLNEGYTQICMETPYRNKALLKDLLQTLPPETLLCIACDIHHPENEYICTDTVRNWNKKGVPDLHKRPAIFIIGHN